MKQKITLYVLLLLVCRAVAAEPINKPDNTTAAHPSISPKNVETIPTGPANVLFQVMRLSRDRNWGHPRLLDFLERFANDARHLDHWPGLLVGDMSQPWRTNGHRSHEPSDRA